MVRSPCCVHQQVDLKKGPWTPDEDQKLLAYIQEHGHGSWRSLPSKAGDEFITSGLRRCGKSCRLRWTNYLRPDIKRGRFSLQEEQTIIQLHAFLGNRWSAIATHLPQRTDNEIKNYWNTHLKKRLTKMGIDPVTHKPKIHNVLSCNQPKDAANLSHIAQWESARLEAESKLVHRSNLISNHYRSQLLGKTVSSTAPSGLGLELPHRPPCLDILKVWQGPWTKHKNDNNAHAKLNGVPVINGSLESNISSGKMPTTVSSIQDSSFIASTFGKPNNMYESNGMKGTMDYSAELRDVVEPCYSAYVYDSLRFPNFMEGYNGLPTCSNRTCEEFVASCNGDFEDNEINYWSNLLNVTTL